MNDNTATTWRDLTDQLTPEQIAELEWWETRPDIPPRADGAPTSSTQHQGVLLFTAREYAGQNAAAIAHADVEVPPDAVSFDAWSESDNGDSVDMRFFTGACRVIESINVSIQGRQYSDGRTERTVRVEPNGRFNDGDMSAEQSRLVAAALIDAADELDAIEGGGAL